MLREEDEEGKERRRRNEREIRGGGIEAADAGWERVTEGGGRERKGPK